MDNPSTFTTTSQPPSSSPSTSFSKPSFSTPASPAQNVNFSKPPSPVNPVLMKIHSRSRILKIKRDETSAVEDEVAHERYMQASQKVSLSFGDIFIDNNSTEVRKRVNSCIEPISVLTSVQTLPANSASSSSPKTSIEGNSTSLQKQCYSPSTNQIVENNLPYSPSPTPSPTRHRILRSCSPRTLLSRPSSLNGIGQGTTPSTITGLKRKRPDAISVGGSPYTYDSDSESGSSTISLTSSTGIQMTSSSINTAFRGTLFPTKKPKLARNCPSPLTKVSTTPTEGLVITSFNNFPSSELSYQDILEFENDNASNVATTVNFIEPSSIVRNGNNKIKTGNTYTAKTTNEDEGNISTFMEPIPPAILDNIEKQRTINNDEVNTNNTQNKITFCDDKEQQSNTKKNINEICKTFDTDGIINTTGDFSFQSSF
uniref:Uncharacterized protein n=1 Tax=Strongyloides venezuelensis TaxID=75913 RepID=A0A0K0FVF7_STRVS